MAVSAEGASVLRRCLAPRFSRLAVMTGVFAVAAAELAVEQKRLQTHAVRLSEEAIFLLCSARVGLLGFSVLARGRPAQRVAQKPVAHESRARASTLRLVAKAGSPAPD